MPADIKDGEEGNTCAAADVVVDESAAEGGGDDGTDCRWLSHRNNDGKSIPQSSMPPSPPSIEPRGVAPGATATRGPSSNAKVATAQ